MQSLPKPDSYRSVPIVLNSLLLCSQVFWCQGISFERWLMRGETGPGWLTIIKVYDLRNSPGCQIDNVSPRKKPPTSSPDFKTLYTKQVVQHRYTVFMVSAKFIFILSETKKHLQDWTNKLDIVIKALTLESYKQC